MEKVIYIDGKRIDHVEELIFLRVKTQKNIWTGKYKCNIDYGVSFESKSVITNENGDPYDFRSEVDVMNYLHKMNYDFLESMISTDPSSGMKMTVLTFKRRSK